MHKRRLYVVPHLHPFTSCITTSSFLQQQPSQQSITLHCRFSSKARLGYLLDHVVMGRPLLPAAAMMELAAATAATLTQDAAHEAGALLTISNMSISAPIILPTASAGGDGSTEDFEVVCRLNLATGQLSIGYTYDQDAGFEPVTCATATASLVQAPQPQRQHGTHLQAAAAALLSDVLPCSATASPGSSAVAGPVGIIAAVSSDWAASGYFSVPQQVDSALHLGVVAPGSGAKVPVAVGSFLVPSAAARTPGTGQLHASTCSSSSSLTTGTPAGLSSSSFILSSSDSSTGGACSAAGRVPGQAAAVDAAAGGLVVVVDDLQTKVVKRSDLSKVIPQRQAAATPAGQEQQQSDDTASGRPDQSADKSYPCSYETEWQAKEAAAAGGLPAAVDSRHAGKLALLVHDASPAAASRDTGREHLVLRLSSGSERTLTPAAAAASALGVLQQVNQVQQAHAAAGTAQQLSIHAALSAAGSTLGPAHGLQGVSAAAAADAGNALWALLRTEATEQTSTAVTLHAVDSTAPTASAGISAAGGAAGALQASAVMGGALEVPRLLPCSRPEGAELITIQPEPRSALSNLVARAADMSQVSSQRLLTVRLHKVLDTAPACFGSCCIITCA
jgi:hypothetical protein